MIVATDTVRTHAVQKLHRNFLIFAILFPVLLMFALMVYKQRIVSQGTRVILKISGYDPRDLLSGHYLLFRVNYGVTPGCNDHEAEPAYVCLTKQTFEYGEPKDCAVAIAGICQSGRFVAGIERFYVPQENAFELEKHVRGKDASIELAIKNGKAQIVDLLIEGQSWRKKIESSPAANPKAD
jgi:uncharacterized membrane-anchored protein